MSELITARIRSWATRLGVGHLADTVEVLLARAEADQLGYLELLDLVLQEEVGRREGRRFRNALNLSGFPHRKTLDDFDFAFQPDLDPRKVRDLTSLQFVTDLSNVVLLGPPLSQDHARRRPGRRRLPSRLLDLLHRPRRPHPPPQDRRDRRAVPQEAPDLPAPRVLVLDEVGYSR